MDSTSDTKTPPVPTSNALEIRGLTKTYYTGFLRKKIVALQGVSFDVRAGRCFALLGPNGSGKTTLIKIVTGLVRPTRGSIRVLGRPLGTAARSCMGFVPDRPHHYPFLTPAETLSFQADFFGLKAAQKKQRIDEVLSLVQMQAHRNLRQRYFSKGMLQRVALAQALLADPALLILDEPIGALDPRGFCLLREIFQNLVRTGKTVVFTSHLLQVAQDIAQDFLVLDKGRVVRQGAMADLSKGHDLEDLYLSCVQEF